MTSTVSPLIGNPVCVSRNLRGIRDYARRSSVLCVITSRGSGDDPGGTLHVIYADGCIGHASFASHVVLFDWARNRRTWQHAEFREVQS